MKSKKTKEIINKGIMEQEAYYTKKLNEEEKMRRKQDDPAKPSLIKRFASIIIDGLIILVVMFGLQFIAFNSVINELGYLEDQTYMKSCLEESHLYVQNEIGSFVTISSVYDNSKTPEENYENAIVTFYTTNNRAIENNKIADFNQAKLDSELYNFDGTNYVKLDKATDAQIKEFLEIEYVKAVKFLKSDPKYVKASNHSLMLSVVTLMLCATISSLIFYLIIPLFTKDHVSIGQLIFGLILVNDTDKKDATESQVIIRYVILLITTFILPILITTITTDFAGLPIFINTGVICFTKNNESFHGFFSKTKIINKSRSNAMETYKQLKEMIDVEKKNNPDLFNKK